jgi:acid phosphatase family membrane protein YuiD
MTRLILSVAITWGVANMLKPIITWIRSGKLGKETVFTKGGMPSGHTALSAPLATALFFETGFSPLFVTALILTILVVYDAVWVRTVIEKQSRTINALIADRNDLPKMEENVGHTPVEVLVSLILSFLIPVIIYSVF